MKDVSVGQDVRYKKRLLKFASVKDGKVITIDAAAKTATVAFNDDTVEKLSFEVLEPLGSTVVKARVSAGSLVSRYGF